MNHRKKYFGVLLAATAMVGGLAIPDAVGDDADGSPVRRLPYPYHHVVTFVSDVDLQAPWLGAAVHRVFNEQIGLPISDSVWVHGDSHDASTFFTGTTTLNQRPSSVQGLPVYALLLRQWHRGNIDHFHGWQDDATFQLRNEFPKKPALGSDTVVLVPTVVPQLASGHYSHLRLYFDAPLPDDLSLLLEFGENESLVVPFEKVIAGKREFPARANGGPKSLVEVIVDNGSPAGAPPAEQKYRLGQMRKLHLRAASCRGGCDVHLLRVERDQFSRRTTLVQLPWLAAWNVRPPLLTSHGGYTLAQDFCYPGFVLDLSASRGPEFADPSTNLALECLADREQSHAYHKDVLRKLGVVSVWNYANDPKKARANASWENGMVLPPLARHSEGLYIFPRTYFFNFDHSSRDKFRSDVLKHEPRLADADLDSFYCSDQCSSDAGAMLGLLTAFSLLKIRDVPPVEHIWYTHFGAGDGSFRRSPRQPLKRTVIEAVRHLANAHYNFDKTVDPAHRIWVPPAATWSRYRIVQAHIGNYTTVNPKNSEIRIQRWTDPVTGVILPDSLSETRDLHGITIYVPDPQRARVLLDGKPTWYFTRNPADESGRKSVTIVDGRSPTVVVDEVAMAKRGTVDVVSGNFVDAGETRGGGAYGDRFMTLEAGSSGEAQVVFKPGVLDFWNITHLHFAVRHRSAPEANVRGRLRIDIEMRDGGVISITEGEGASPPAGTGAGWSVPMAETPGKWVYHTLDTARMTWTKACFKKGDAWCRPPLPIGRVRQVQMSVAGAAPGEKVDLDGLMALRPSGNGESSTGGKLIAGRVLLADQPVADVNVSATNDRGQIVITTTDRHGLFYFYDRPNGERLTITAAAGARICHPKRGAMIEVRKNEAELDIVIDNTCELVKRTQ